MPFRFHSEKVHLTYSTHIDIDALDAFLTSKGDVKIMSIVHEVGDADEYEPTPYEHTHAFVWYRSRLDTIDVRFFDFNGIHPHASTKRSMIWAKNICMKYHCGHKTKKDGRKYYIEPVKLYQRGVEDWRFEEELLQRAIDAPTLKEACLELDIMPKSCSDVAAFRRDSTKRKFDQLPTGRDRSQYTRIDWDRTKALIVRGPAGCGKTSWAIAQFERPWKVEDLDELKDMPHDTDGIIFDECLFDDMSKKGMVALTDYEQPRTIRTRFTNARIPREMPKIFTCNEHEHPFGDNPATGGCDAIKRRIVLMDVTRFELLGL